MRIRAGALPATLALFLGSVLFGGQALAASRSAGRSATAPIHESVPSHVVKAQASTTSFERRAPSGSPSHAATPSAQQTQITFRAASAVSNGKDTTLVIPVPTSVKAGDVLIAVVYVRGPTNVIPPAGWSLVRSDGRASVYKKTASAEISNYTWTLVKPASAAGAMVAYSGADASPIMVSSGEVNAESSSITAPSVTTTLANAMVVGFFGIGKEADVTAPSGMTERVALQSGQGQRGLSLEVSDVMKVTVGDTGDKVATSNLAGPNIGQLVALKPAAQQPSATLDVLALNSYSAQLTWTAPDGTAEIKILRDGRLIDDFSSSGVTTYTDYLLWESTQYTYELKTLDSSGTVLSDLSVSTTTPSQSGSFPKPYSLTSFINLPIGSNPAIDSNSASMISKAILAYDSGANLNKSDTWAYPIAFSSTGTESYLVKCLLYGCDLQVGPFPIPSYTEPNEGADGHVTIVDTLTNQELDMWQASYDPGTDTWSASSRYETDYDGWGALCGEGEHCGSAVAAGFAEMAGVIRPEEIAQGHIDHALVFTTPYTRSGFIACPATHTDGQYNDAAAIPEGARIQLDPKFNVDAQSWPAWEKTIAKALQTYGAFLVDTGGTLSIRGESNLLRGYDAWALAGVTSSSLSSLPWDQFRVLKLDQC